MERFFKWIERIGNKLPNPFWLFVYISLFVLIASLIASLLGVSAVDPRNGETIHVVNLISGEGLKNFVTNMVSNFAHFAPLGLVLVMLMGISVAEGSGMIEAIMRGITNKIPDKLIVPVIIVLAACGNIGSDAGIIIIPPIAAVLFKNMGKSPIAGLVVAYAAATAGFTANLIPAGTDVLLAALTTEAYQSFKASGEVVATCNWYFMIASTFLIAVIGTWVAYRYTIPHFGKSDEKDDTGKTRALTDLEKKGLIYAAVVGVIYLTLVSLTIVLENGLLRHPDPGKFMRSPFFKGLVPILFFFFVFTGYTYGKITGSIGKGSDLVSHMTKGMKGIAGFLVLFLVISQFVKFFQWSNLDKILSIHGATFLKSAGFDGPILIVFFIFFIFIINLLVGSSSAKWAFLAPVFVPMFHQLGFSPAFTQLLYRIGDSSTNGISPLYPYFALILGWVVQRDKKAGIGTVISLLLPYSLFIGLGWIILVLAWYFLGLPIGIGEPIRM